MARWGRSGGREEMMRGKEMTDERGEKASASLHP